MVYALIAIGIILLIVLHVAIAKHKYKTTREKRIHNRNIEFEHFKNHNIKDLIVFVGDSITEQFKVDEYFLDKNVINRGVSGNYTYEVLERLDTIISHKPHMIVLCIGTNDMSRKDISVETAFENINTIITRLQEEVPSTKIILHCLYPINTTSNPIIDKKTQRKAGYYPEKVHELNIKLKKRYLGSTVEYLDTTRMMSDTSGNLLIEYTVDGVHLSHKGYDFVSKLLRETFDNVLSK